MSVPLPAWHSQRAGFARFVAFAAAFFEVVAGYTVADLRAVALQEFVQCFEQCFRAEGRTFAAAGPAEVPAEVGSVTHGRLDLENLAVVPYFGTAVAAKTRPACSCYTIAVGVPDWRPFAGFAEDYPLYSRPV